MNFEYALLQISILPSVKITHFRMAELLLNPKQLEAPWQQQSQGSVLDVPSLPVRAGCSQGHAGWKTMGTTLGPGARIAFSTVVSHKDP